MKIDFRRPSDAAPQRIGALSVLPVFLNLAGKRAVIAGGTAAAAWKAELLSAAGAKVEVFASIDETGPEMTALAERGSGVILAGHSWNAACLRGATVAIADAATELEAVEFEAAARAAGAVCNIIDKPAFCHFQFGSIVNRSPVVIGISTSGAAPVLGQAIRRRIEALLPRSLAHWAAIAQQWREHIAASLVVGPARRAFWEWFVDRAFSSADARDAERALAQRLRQPAAVHAGAHVTFIGAGGGDAELLTLKAVRALHSADVILFDELTPHDVLELARREAGRVPVADGESITFMLAHTGASRRVVRIVRGDPLTSSDYDAETEALDAANISYDIIPGISDTTSRGRTQSRTGSRETHLN